jgi:hypothetical protein
MDQVNAWKQVGRVFLWRYPPHLRKHSGWHFTAEDNACESLVKLLETMRLATFDKRRTIILTKPSPPIWGVPNFGKPRIEALGPLTISYEKSFADLMLVEDDERLLLRVGDDRVDELLAGLKDVRKGEGDYAIWSIEKGTSTKIWLWWMPWSGAR